MLEIPKTLEDAIAQSQNAVETAIETGLQRVQVELVIPEIALKAQAIALEFAQYFSKEYGSGVKVVFPDTGAASLARRDWGDTEFSVTDIGSRFTPIETKISDEDQFFLLIAPSAVEVGAVEKLCNLAGDRPVILLIPQLESVSTVGIGYAARQLRDRFLSTLETAYYIKPFDGGAIFRSYPSLWQVWIEKEDNTYELFAEEPQKPVGDRLERILNGESEDAPEGMEIPSQNKGILGSLQQFLRALSN
ncbi:MAG: DUF1995 family protein [Kamptonema sp. SIO4C4]|nr:DUF1995 family protein [Kamptonema sp. SIO4C4]